MKISEMKTKDLIEIAHDCYQAVYVSDCFSASDMINLENASKELEKRGYEMNEEQTKLRISRV